MGNDFIKFIPLHFTESSLRSVSALSIISVPVKEIKKQLVFTKC